MGALDDIAEWPVTTAAAGVTGPAGTIETYGDLDWQIRVASITKILVAYAGLIAVEEGSFGLDDPAGPPGSTFRHLLAHASGMPFYAVPPVAPPGKRRIYSNTGYDAFGHAMAQATGVRLADYLHEGVCIPLGMTRTELRTSPAYGGYSTVRDLLRFGRELLAPTLITPETLAEATTEQFPGLAGVIPGMGRYAPNPWGLGFELKDHKTPHWTAPDSSPRTFGHFGASGTFLWVDPDAQLSCVVLTDRKFDDWAPPLWRDLSTKVLELDGARA